MCGKSITSEISTRSKEQNQNDKRQVTWWDDTKGIALDSVFVSDLTRDIVGDGNYLADSNTAGKQSEKPENQFFVAMTRLGKPAFNLDQSKEQPAGIAELQLGKAGEGSTSQTQRALQVKLAANYQTEKV